MESQEKLSIQEKSFKWAFSKPPNKKLLAQIDNLAKQHAPEMTVWLRSFLSEDTKERYRTVAGEFPVDVAPSDYIERLNLFVGYFDRLL